MGGVRWSKIFFFQFSGKSHMTDALFFLIEKCEKFMRNVVVKAADLKKMNFPPYKIGLKSGHFLTYFSIVKGYSENFFALS
jgi:hypothetical protein